MVSLWPWKKGGDDTTASFEKTLSALSTKIKKGSLQRDSLTSRSRRFKALWTLYTGFIYTLISLILVLVTGWRNWNLTEYVAIIAGPVIILLGRAGLAAYYQRRLSNIQLHLDLLNQQRDDAIEKFKTATKYNSTQQLLEKYGAAPLATTSARPSSTSATKRQPGGAKGEDKQQSARTGLAPPPTANIRRQDETITWPQTPSPRQDTKSQRVERLQPYRVGPTANFSERSHTEAQPDAEFAPNAFSAAPQYADSRHGLPTWYDRIMDVLLGEDETRPVNRIVLICSHCKLVNGQAPPGVRRLEDIGRWRCSECHELNGAEDEVRTMIMHAAGKQTSAPSIGRKSDTTDTETSDIEVIEKATHGGKGSPEDQELEDLDDPGTAVEREPAGKEADENVGMD